MTPVRLEPGPRGVGVCVGGGVLRYFHTYVGSDHFLGFKILNFNIFFWGGGGFQNSFFFRGVGCMKILWIFLMG